MSERLQLIIVCMGKTAITGI